MGARLIAKLLMPFRQYQTSNALLGTWLYNGSIYRAVIGGHEA